MKRKFRFIQMIFWMAAFVFLMNFAYQRHSHRTCSKFDISIEDSSSLGFISSKNVVKLLQLHDSLTVKEISIASMEETLMQNPYVDSVNVSQTIDGRLKIFIRQKRPICRVNNRKEAYYLDAKADKIPLSTTFSYPCFLVDGNLTSDELPQVVHVVDLIHRDKLLKNHFIGMKKVDKNSFVLFVNYGDYIIKFGKLNQAAQKLENLKGFYTQYLNRLEPNVYSVIDLSYEHQIVATKKTSHES